MMRLRLVMVGFAIMLSIFAAIAAVLIAKGHASRGTLGISLGAR